jgi:hypothetical protein
MRSVTLRKKTAMFWNLYVSHNHVYFYYNFDQLSYVTAQLTIIWANETTFDSMKQDSTLSLDLE